MTVDTYSAGGALASYADPDLEESGLEDLDAEDVRVPRLKIVGKRGVFQDTLTKVEMPEINAIILGMTKQRIMWRREVDENEQPLCKSPDFVTGYPNVEARDPDKVFPWMESGFDLGTYNHYSDDPAHSGHVVLPCAKCKFKDWNGKKPPRCAESFAYAILYGEPDSEPTMPAILTLQRSAISAAKTYNAFFAAQKIPFFQFYTRMTLVQKSRGDVEYAVPVLQRGGGTDQSQWIFFAQQARAIREMLRQAPRPMEGWTPLEPSANVNTAPAATTPAPSAPAPAAPAPAPAPAPAAPAPAPAPAPATPPAPPVAPPAPPAPQAAPPAPPAPAPSAPAAPAAPAAEASASTDDDDELPF